jgi:hypothetical protein
MPKVQVVSAFHNRAKLLARTVDSIVEQTYTDVIHDVVDDGSSDAFTDAMTPYIHQNRVHVRSQTNRGFVATMIEMIAVGDSAYVAVLGSGDAAHPERLERQVALLDDRPDLGFVASYIDVHPADGGSPYEVRYDLGNNPTEALMKRVAVTHTSITFRRSVYEKVGGYRREFKLSQDLDLWLRMSEISGAAVIPQPLTRHYPQAISVSGGISERRLAGAHFIAMARYAASERMRVKRDPIDAFGSAAFSMRPRSRRLSRMLAKEARLATSFNRMDVAQKAIELSLREAIGWRQILVKAMVSVPLAQQAYRIVCPPQQAAKTGKGLAF